MSCGYYGAKAYYCTRWDANGDCDGFTCTAAAMTQANCPEGRTLTKFGLLGVCCLENETPYCAYNNSSYGSGRQCGMAGCCSGRISKGTGLYGGDECIY